MVKLPHTYPTWARIIALSLVGLLVLGIGGLLGYRLGRYQSLRPPLALRNAVNTRENNTSSQVNFGLFWQAWNAIDDNFDGDTSPAKRLDGAIGGMVAGLGDPYTVYLPPSENKLFQTDLQGSFGGIGAELTIKDGLLVVVSPLQDSPAEHAGLKAQDIIVEVAGQKTSGQNFNDVINQIRGPKGSSIDLMVARQGVDQPFKVTVVRDTITVKSVKTSSLGKDGSIAYIKVNQFGQDTTDLFKSALQAVQTAHQKGVIIDMRNNPGGYLQGAADDIGMLLPSTVTSNKEQLHKRTAVIERFRDGTEKDDPAGMQSILDTTPIVVLVNGGSASAAEIFSGAMRDYGRAKIIGTKTFGKGSAQELFPLSNNGSVKVTIAKWFTPLGVGIDGKGLDPDTVVELPKDVTPSDSDAQVSKALQLLGAQ